MNSASCIGLDPADADVLFFGADDDQQVIEGDSNRHARHRICGACPVRRECEDFAEATHTVEGAWGGVLRRQGRRRRAAGAAS